MERGLMEKCFKCCEELIGSRKQSLEKTNDLLNLFKCKYCSYRTRFYNNYRKHMWLHTKSKNYKSICYLRSPEKYCCQLCNFQSHLKIFMTKHFNAVHKAEEAQLYQVKYTQNLPSKASKNKHETQTKQKIKFFQCQRCFYTSKEKERVQNHVHKEHTPPILQTCTLSSAKGTSSLLGELEKLRHFQCAFCSYKATEEDNLEYHMLLEHIPFENK